MRDIRKDFGRSRLIYVTSTPQTCLSDAKFSTSHLSDISAELSLKGGLGKHCLYARTIKKPHTHKLSAMEKSSVKPAVDVDPVDAQNAPHVADSFNVGELIQLEGVDAALAAKMHLVNNVCISLLRRGWEMVD